MASSDYPFFAAGSEIGGSTTMFDGETLSSGYLPAWLDFQDGARYALGVGSQARVFADRVELDGVSLEVVAAGSRLRRIVAAGLRFQPLDESARATIYSDRPEVVSVFVAEGEWEVLLVDGSRGARIKQNQFATFSRTFTSPRFAGAESAPRDGADPAARAGLRPDTRKRVAGVAQGAPAAERLPDARFWRAHRRSGERRPGRTPMERRRGERPPWTPSYCLARRSRSGPSCTARWAGTASGAGRRTAPRRYRRVRPTASPAMQPPRRRWTPAARCAADP